MKAQIADIYRPLTRRSTAYQLLSFALNLLCAWLVSHMLAAAIAANGAQMRMALLLSLLSIAAGGVLLKYLKHHCSRTAQDSLHAYRQWVCEQVIAGTLDVPTSGELDARLQGDAETISTFYGNAFPRMMASGITGAVCIALLLAHDVRLALLLGTLSLLQLLPTLLYERWAKAIYQQTMADIESYSNWMAEGLHGIRTIKSYQQENWFLKRFEKNNRALILSGRREAQTAAVEDIVSSLISTVLTYGSYLIVGFFVLHYGIAAVQVPLLLVLTQQLFSAVTVVMRGRSAQFRYQQAVVRLGHFVPQMPPARTQDTSVACVQQVAKAYGEKRVLHNVSLRINKGERVLLEGANGSGKTTLMRILLGLLVPDVGQVALHAASSAFVFQDDPPLHLPAQDIFDAFCRANTIDREAFDRHAQAFDIRHIMDKSPMDCSSGERKKFYLAIALARNADFLVLDEPTNHLDANSVAYLLACLSAYTGTLLVCTHQARLALDWDRTYRMSEGELHAA